MPQILKEEYKLAIINSAREEFLKYGYKGASMRNIAKNANMTVGNLYRYFKNKEEISTYIINETDKKLKDIITKITSNEVSMEARVFNIKPDVKQLKNSIDQFVESLVDLYMENKTEFRILLFNSKLNKEIYKWLESIFSSLIYQDFQAEGSSIEYNVLSKTYVETIFYGFKYLFSLNNIDGNQLKNIVKTYLNSYVVMLDNDIKNI